MENTFHKCGFFRLKHMQLKIFLVYCVFLQVSLIHAQGETRFVKHHYFPYQQTEYRNILVTDTCYWIMGWATDTIYPYYWTAITCKVSLSGDLLKTKTLIYNWTTFGWPEGIHCFENKLYTAYKDRHDSVRIVVYDISKDSMYQYFSWGKVNPKSKYIYEQVFCGNKNGDQYIATTSEGDTLLKNDSEIQLIKLDKDKQTLFVKQYHIEDRYVDLRGIKEMKNGDVFILGDIRLPNYQKYNDDSYRGYALLVNSSGDSLTTIICDQFSDGFRDILQTNDNSLICASSKIRHLGNGDGKPLIVKLNYSGKTIWEITVDSSEYSGSWVFYNNMRKILQIDSLNFTGICGIEKLDAQDIFYPYIDYRVCIINFNLDGKVNWQRIYKLDPQGFEQPSIFDAKRTLDGGYIHSGLYNLSTSKNTESALLIKTDSLGCLIQGCDKIVNVHDIHQGKTKAFEIFPNPITKDLLVLLSRVDTDKLCKYSLSNLEGIEIMSHDQMFQRGVQYLIKISDKIPNGEYLFSIHGQDFNQCEKIIILR